KQTDPQQTPSTCPPSHRDPYPRGSRPCHPDALPEESADKSACTPPTTAPPNPKPSASASLTSAPPPKAKSPAMDPHQNAAAATAPPSPFWASQRRGRERGQTQGALLV